MIAVFSVWVVRRRVRQSDYQPAVFWGSSVDLGEALGMMRAAAARYGVTSRRKTYRGVVVLAHYVAAMPGEALADRVRRSVWCILGGIGWGHRMARGALFPGWYGGELNSSGLIPSDGLELARRMAVSDAEAVAKAAAEE